MTQISQGTETAAKIGRPGPPNAAAPGPIRLSSQDFSPREYSFEGIPRSLSWAIISLGAEMEIIIVALISLIAVPLYFLRLMADGRRLRESLRERREARATASLEENEPLIAADQRSWLAPPYRMREDTPSAWPPL